MDNEVLAEYIRYHRWATVTTLDACAMLDTENLRRDLRAAYQSIWGTLVHIYQADCVWWNRFQGQHTGSLSAFEPGADLQELQERWLSQLDEMVSWAESRTGEQWAAEFEYRNTKGEPFRQPVWEAALHMANHGTLHFGQILTMFRQLDRVPTGVDLIFYYRDRAKRLPQTVKA